MFLSFYSLYCLVAVRSGSLTAACILQKINSNGLTVEKKLINRVRRNKVDTSDSDNDEVETGISKEVSNNSNNEIQVTAPTLPTQPPTKRKPGRPPKKNSNIEIVASKPNKQRGRPRKVSKKRY